MTDFPSIAGVRATDRADGRLALTFDEVSEATCRRVVAALPEDRQLTFHDPYFPQLSEPGAYVSIQRRGNLFKVYWRNHGWSVPWTHQSLELLAAWLALRLRYDGVQSDFDASITVEPVIISAWRETPTSHTGAAPAGSRAALWIGLGMAIGVLTTVAWNAAF